MVYRQGSVESEPVDLDEEVEEEEDWLTMRVSASPATAGPRPVMRRDMPICWLGTRQKCARIIIKYPKCPSTEVALFVNLEGTFCTVPEGWQQALCSTVRRAARSGSAAAVGCVTTILRSAQLFFTRQITAARIAHHRIVMRLPGSQYALFTAFKVKRMTFRLWGHISRNLVLEMLC